MAIPTPTIQYSLDGNLLHTVYGVYVQATRGLLDLPKMKDPIKYSSPDLPGDIVDLASPQFEAKEFYLDCMVQATSILDGIQKVNTFLKALIAPIATIGTHRLQITVDASSYLVYQVYCPDAVAINQRFIRSSQTLTFSVKLREPEPVKKIYKWTAPPYACTISVQASKPLNIYWGDATMNADLTPDTVNTIAHTYGSTGVKWIIITGDVDSISYLSTTATLVWEKLI